MGVVAARMMLEAACDEIVAFRRFRPILALPRILVAGEVLDCPILRVKGRQVTVVLVYATGTFQIEEFARNPNNPTFARVGAPIGSVASVDQAGAVIEEVFSRRPTFGQEQFFRITNTAGAPNTLLGLDLRGAVI